MWSLDNEASRINFVSTKSNSAAEVHTFGVIEGDVDDGGQVTLSIDLSTVDTAIEIRDERMRSMLFETEQYPSAELSATVDADALRDLAVGDVMTTTSEAQLMLHGTIASLTVDLQVAKLSEERILVTSQKPLVVNASQVGLVEGVEKLREVAGLPSISPAVPVTFSLVFERS